MKKQTETNHSTQNPSLFNLSIKIFFNIFSHCCEQDILLHIIILTITLVRKEIHDFVYLFHNKDFTETLISDTCLTDFQIYLLLYRPIVTTLVHGDQHRTHELLKTKK